MASTFNSTLLKATQSPFAMKLQQMNVRRSIVIVGTLWLLVMWLAFPYITHSVGLLLLIDIPFLLLSFMLVLSVYSLFELPDDALDERQILIRNGAYKKAYGFTLVFLVIVATVATGLSLDKLHAFATAAVSFLAAALAPRAIAAWTLHDSPEDKPCGT